MGLFFCLTSIVQTWNGSILMKRSLKNWKKKINWMILWEVNERMLLLFAFVLGKLWKPKQHCMRRWQEVKLKVRHCMLLHVNKICWSVLLYFCFIYFILISYIFFYLLLLKMKVMMKKEGDFWWTSTRKFIQRYGRKSMSYFFSLQKHYNQPFCPSNDTYIGNHLPCQILVLIHLVRFVVPLKSPL